jgi:hypothetical protein
VQVRQKFVSDLFQFHYLKDAAARAVTDSGAKRQFFQRISEHTKRKLPQKRRLAATFEGS